MGIREIIGYIAGWVIVIVFGSFPFIWIWIFYHRIKCRKVESCTNRKCRYWDQCEHNLEERRKDALEMRKKALEMQMEAAQKDKH